MKLTIHAVGRIGKSPEAELCARYSKRLAWPITIKEWPDGSQISLPPASGETRTIVLDERGQTLGSAPLAAKIGQWRDAGVRELRFAIGGADGHAEAVRADADLLLAFGPATWPHMLARVMLLEQLYRAQTILTCHPYHRA
jgi:23S rRNA (pseudouridine1915-N3)-methyltransferase